MGEILRSYAERDGRGYPDWALRYVPIAHRMRRLFISSGVKSPRVLEIGANTCGLSRFAPFSIVAVNKSREELLRLTVNTESFRVVADATRLPFLAETFDGVACIDTLEHLPKPERLTAVTEICRVLGTHGIGVIAFPYGQDADLAEKQMGEAYFSLTQRRLPWLEEHTACGLPDPIEVRGSIENAIQGTHDVKERNNTPIWLWKIIWYILLCGWPGRGNAVFQALLRLFVPILVHIRFGEAYRKELWIIPKSLGKSPPGKAGSC